MAKIDEEEVQEHSEEEGMILFLALGGDAHDT